MNLKALGISGFAVTIHEDKAYLDINGVRLSGDFVESLSSSTPIDPLDYGKVCRINLNLYCDIYLPSNASEIVRAPNLSPDPTPLLDMNL